MRPVAVITGASAGIGAELARVFAANGHQLALVARREQRLRELAEEIAASGHPKPLVMALDLAQRDAGIQLGRVLAANDCEPQYMVNNAGFGLIGHVAELDRAQQLEIVDVNARTLLDLSLAFVDSLARIAAASSMSPRSRASCRVLVRRFITRQRRSRCRSARPCIRS